MQHQLIQTFLGLKGNPRACVYAEPLWGIPYNLYAPYASVFMLALGLADRQIGFILSVSWAIQVVFSLLSGAITDKLGRRWTTLIFDIVAWSGSALISAIAQNYWFFLAAGLVNSVWRITQNSWSCLLVEDADPAQLVGIYSWIYIANIIVGFVAPLKGLLIGRFTMVPTLRALYFFAAGMFAIKALVTFVLTDETARGKERKRETKGQGLPSILSGYGAVLRSILGSKRTLYTAAIMIIVSVCSMISASFWPILATKKLGLRPESLALFPFVKSTVTIALFFTLTPILGKLRFRLPLAFGFLVFAASQLLYMIAPARGFALLIAGAILEAGGLAIANPLVDRMVVLNVDAKERARIQSLLYVCVILVSSPFGWVAGELSHLDNSFPFALTIALYALGAVLSLAAGREKASSSG
jgi:MFS family permease